MKQQNIATGRKLVGSLFQVAKTAVRKRSFTFHLFWKRNLSGKSKKKLSIYYSRRMDELEVKTKQQ